MESDTAAMFEIGFTPPGFRVVVTGWRWRINPMLGTVEVVTEGDVEVLGLANEDSGTRWIENIFDFPEGTHVDGNEPPWWAFSLAWSTVVPQVLRLVAGDG